MNILHIVSGKLSGGAARGALWLHQALLEAGINSRILNNSRTATPYEKIEAVAQTRKGYWFSLITERLDKLPAYLYRSRKNLPFSTALVGLDIKSTASYEWADVIHLHWINLGFVSLRTISEINKPLVWTMRDMWPMTGGCHISMGCERYIEGCGKCAQLNSDRTKDLSRYIFSRKSKLIPKRVKLVGISNWLTGCANNSLLFRDFDVSTINNGINLQDFFPVDKTTARSILGLNTDKKIVLIGAQSINVPYKGFDKAIDAIKLIERKDILFLFFGRLDNSSIEKLQIDYLSLGFLHDSISLRLVYSAADLFLAPSIMDAFGKTLAESLACATPVVCFDSTGPRDIVDHKINGYKAVPYVSEDLAAGINWILSDNQQHEILCKNAREKAVTSFDIKIIAKQYHDLYSSIL